MKTPESEFSNNLILPQTWHLSRQVGYMFNWESHSDVNQWGIVWQSHACMDKDSVQSGIYVEEFSYVHQEGLEKRAFLFRCEPCACFNFSLLSFKNWAFALNGWKGGIVGNILTFSMLDVKMSACPIQYPLPWAHTTVTGKVLHIVL